MMRKGKRLVLSYFVISVFATVWPSPVYSCELEGFALGRGRKLYLLKTASTLDCSNLCSTNPRCTHWSFEGLSSFCTLRSDDPNNRILIRRHNTTISAGVDCSLTLQLTNAEGLCFSDGWIVSSLEEGETTGKMEGVRGSPLQSISITESPEECRGLCQHGLVQESEEPCSMWEWEVATKTCSLFRSGTRLSRPDDLPLGFSILSKMLTGKGEESDLKLIGAAGVRMLEKSLVAMKTIVGTRFCSNLALARNVETQRSKVQSKASCDIPEHRDFPWMTRSDMLVPTRPTTKLRIKPFPPDAGVCSTPHPPKVTPGCKTTTDWFMFWMVRATSHFSMLSMYSLEDVEEFKQLAAGFDSRTPYLEAVTDRTKDIVECQQLCQNTANCNVFTFYIDYRSDANCVLKGKVLRQDMFEHPVAITGSKTEKTALALRGMKFGYAMKHRTTVGSGADPEDFDPYHLLTRTAQLDILARQMCERFSYEGWAVIDYTSRQVYAVPANGAVEAYSPMSNYISCRKVS